MKEVYIGKQGNKKQINKSVFGIKSKYHLVNRLADVKSYELVDSKLV